MRNKVISVITVIIVYAGAFFWSGVNIPITPGPHLVVVELAATTIMVSFSVLGLFLSLYITIKWLCAK